MEKYVVEMDTLKDKYVKRLANACKDGFTCCLIDKEDELWLNWE